MTDNKQLLMFPVWWHDPNLWKAHKLPSDLQRPVEDKALDNIYMLSKVEAGEYRLVLSQLELEVDRTFVACKQARSGYEDKHYIEQTAMRLHMPIFQIRGILDEIDYVKRNIASYEDAGYYDMPKTA